MWINLQHAWALVWQPGNTPGREYLDRRYFLMTLGAAFALHLLALYAWYLMPKTQVVDIPVRALNIKLGSDETAEDLKAAQPDAANKGNVENTISHLVRDQDPAEQARVQSVASSIDKVVSGILPRTSKTPVPRSHAVVKGTFDVRQEGLNTAAPVMAVTAHQFVRENSVTATVPGNSNAHDAETVSRYEQLVSLWIEKFKVYPQEAQAQKLEGETMLRIRIDPRGNINYYILEYSTGHPELDKAAVDMVKRANPVPAAPADYPQKDQIEFLIPVKFHLQ